jgi:hypothetical protein
VENFAAGPHSLFIHLFFRKRVASAENLAVRCALCAYQNIMGMMTHGVGVEWLSTSAFYKLPAHAVCGNAAVHFRLSDKLWAVEGAGSGTKCAMWLCA